MKLASFVNVTAELIASVLHNQLHLLQLICQPRTLLSVIIP